MHICECMWCSAFDVVLFARASFHIHWMMRTRGTLGCTALLVLPNVSTSVPPVWPPNVAILMLPPGGLRADPVVGSESHAISTLGPESMRR